MVLLDTAPGRTALQQDYYTVIAIIGRVVRHVGSMLLLADTTPGRIIYY